MVYGKLESQNPAGSVKDRPALRDDRGGREGGQSRPGATIIEATSGNTGISLAMIAAVRGYRCVLVMPEDMSLERRYVLRAYGAEITLTPAADGHGRRGRRARASSPRTRPIRSCRASSRTRRTRRATSERPRSRSSSRPDGKLDAFVAGVGTGGTITGVGRVLREKLGDAVLDRRRRAGGERRALGAAGRACTAFRGSAPASSRRFSIGACSRR